MMTTYARIQPEPDIRLQECPRCHGPMDYREPEEPYCIVCGHRLKWDPRTYSIIGSHSAQPAMYDTLKPNSGRERKGLRGSKELKEGQIGTVTLEVYFKAGVRTVKVEFYIQKLLTRPEFYAVAREIKVVGRRMSTESTRVHTMISETFARVAGMPLKGVGGVMREAQ